MEVCLCFFFSSRRRHTRWPRDWSSDVCSSDLTELLAIGKRFEDVHASLGAHALNHFSQYSFDVFGRKTIQKLTHPNRIAAARKLVVFLKHVHGTKTDALGQTAVIDLVPRQVYLARKVHQRHVNVRVVI